MQTHPQRNQRNRQRVPLVLGAALLVAAAATADGGLVSGHVSSKAEPLPASRVYAYQLTDLSLREVTTDDNGAFSFKNLPTGLYKVIAFKPGFLPGIALLTRVSVEAVQSLEMELQSQDTAAGDSAAGFWAVRQQIPSDVMRKIDLAQAEQDHPALPRLDHISADLRAVTGVDSVATSDASQVSGGHLELMSETKNLNISLEGHYLALEAATDEGSAPTTDGRSQLVSVDVSGLGANRVRVTSLDNSLRTSAGADDERMGLQSHRLSWSRDIGERGKSEVAAQYTAEDNFYARGNNNQLALPSGSRAWNLEGSYSTRLGEHSSIETGFRYRERQFELLDPERLGGLLPEQRIEFFGLAGTAISPAIVVEYGMYSTLRDGTLSLMPQGGLVMQLSDSWRARTSASVKMHEDPLEARRLNDFHTGYFRNYSSCGQATAECYQVVLSRFDGQQEKLSIGALHRRFDETLRVQFDENFFNYRENLQLVHGDAVPELQLALTQRLSPNVLARLESNLGAGGGGLLKLASTGESYENEVRYLVTSVDTQFEQTATGVFVAFHQLQQRLNPTSEQSIETLMELERFQVLLTQDLAVLSSMASDWAVQLNMEFSRGGLPTSGEQLELNDEIRSRITGGLAVKF